MSILAICPSRGRPQAAAETLASFLQTRRDPLSRLVFVVDSDDPTRREYPAEHTRVSRPQGTMGGALTLATHDKGLLGDATAVGMIGDDNRFRTPGWDVTLDAWLTANRGIAYGDDGFQHERLPTSWWLSRQIVLRLGLAHPELRHFYMDNYWLELGKAAGCLRYFPEIVIEHLHPLAGKGTDDPTYQRGSRHAEHDKAWFGRWQRSGGLARDLAILRSIVRQGQPRRVFADWHHPALWESLRLLFEVRFGWELYSPIGAEWKQRAWRFTHNGWGAEDYLVFPEARLVADHWERTEPEYPDHPRKLVTVAQADSMTWDFVLASVAVHQVPFAALAKDWGARFIHQIGNARHPIDRGVAQVTLASALIPRAIRPRTSTVLTYHQEFDRRMFAYSPPTAPERVASFMMRLDSTSCEYRWLAEAKGVRWSAFGGADPRSAGYLVPMSRVASELRRTGWVWHDKKIGDGYGHALHNAAAMGRPLIGHASHYKGMLGEPFWRDLETCIDLDRHSHETAIRLFRAISADREWHTEISANLAREFDKRVDFAAEAEQIRAVLA